LGEKVVPAHLDLSDRETIEKLSEMVPSLDILINNAGIFGATDMLGDNEKQLRNDLETNLFGTLSVTKALLPDLKKANAAAIANVSSIAGLAAMPGIGGYSASKAADHSVTQSLRGSLKSENISVHDIYLGPVETRMVESFEIDKASPAVVADIILEDIESGVEDIFPDAMAQQVGAVYLTSPKMLEQNFAAF
jgi:short-subunit dehydrogenase